MNKIINIIKLVYQIIKGGEDMVFVYVTLIIHSRRTFDQVPDILKEAVKAELLAIGLDENGNPIVG
jgi:hypothetical protein